jgi:hypothetical protein
MSLEMGSVQPIVKDHRLYEAAAQQGGNRLAGTQRRGLRPLAPGLHVPHAST